MVENLQEIHGVDAVEKVAKLLASELESVVPLAEPPIESGDIEILREGAGLVFGEDYVDDPTIERKLVEKSPASVLDDFSNAPVKKLSVADQRRKLRYGMKPPTQ